MFNYSIARLAYPGAGITLADSLYDLQVLLASKDYIYSLHARRIPSVLDSFRPLLTDMAKFLRRLAKRRDATSSGQPEQPRLEPEGEEPRTESKRGEARMESEEKQPKMQQPSIMKPKATLTALYSYNSRTSEVLSFEKG